MNVYDVEIVDTPGKYSVFLLPVLTNYRRRTVALS